MKKYERLEVRIPSDKKKIIQFAADLLGITLSAFVISSCLKEAYSIIGENQKNSNKKMIRDLK